jgi:RimJ/RimL family protein N-acetyltransferase
MLRRFSIEDLSAFQAYRSDPVVARFQGWEPTSDEAARSFLDEQSRQQLGMAGQWLQIAIVRLDTGAVVGDVGLCVVDAEAGSLVLGYTLARAAQGRGFATEAVAAALDALFASGLARVVTAETDARNTPSVALLERLGFARRSTAAAVFRGEACDEHTYVLTADAWGRRRRAEP